MDVGVTGRTTHTAGADGSPAQADDRRPVREGILALFGVMLAGNPDATVVTGLFCEMAEMVRAG